MMGESFFGLQKSHIYLISFVREVLAFRNDIC